VLDDRVTAPSATDKPESQLVQPADVTHSTVESSRRPLSCVSVRDPRTSRVNV